MNLIIVVFISSLLSFIFAWWFKKKLIFVLTITIPSVIILEILITKDISAFYYRYFYHWLFFILLILVLPFGFMKKVKKSANFVGVFFLVWIVLIIMFPIKTVINNIIYLNTDTMWFDSFSRKYSLHQVNIYDYIDWQYPKTKGIIKWCENRKEMTDLYVLSNLLAFDNEGGLHAFFVKCNYKSFDLEINKTPYELSEKIISNHQGAYYFSLNQCQPEIKNPFAKSVNEKAYDVDQMLICSSKQIMPYLYIISKL